MLNLLIQQSSFFLSESRSSAWPVRVTLQFSIPWQLSNSSVCETIFVFNLLFLITIARSFLTYESMYNRKNPCIIALYNGGSKASIQLLGGESLFWHNCQTWNVWARHSTQWKFSLLFNLVYLSDNKTCTWKRGHGPHWYVWKEPITGKWIYGITWKHVLAFIFCLFICFSV